MFENYYDIGAGLDSLNTELQEAENHAKKVSANMGLGGAAVDGISAALDKLGLGKLSETLGLDEAKKSGVSKSLKKKSQASGIPMGILRKVFAKGMQA